MTLKRGPLGRGLGALIDDSKYEKKTVEEVISTGSITEIEIEKIEVNPFQPRTDFNEEALLELASSIKELGIIQPITVRKIEENKFQIISGERRYRASKIAGLKILPAFVRDANDQSMLELALVENIQREDLNAIEVAITYQRLIEECKITHESLSERVGKKRATITNYLRLLKLPAEILAGIRDKQISFGHARALLSLEDYNEQIILFHRIINEELSVRDVEKIIKHLNTPVVEIPVTPVIETEQVNITENNQEQPVTENNQDIYQETEIKQEEEDFLDGFKQPIKEIPLPEYHNQWKEKLSSFFQIKVDVRRDEKGKGRLVIPFNSDDEFSKIAQLLAKLEN